MKEELITLETAKLAKEKGFDVATEFGYGYVEDGSLSNYYTNEYHELKAPTQSLLQKWLREDKKIVVDVFQESKNSKYTGYWQVDISEVGNYKEEELPNPRILDLDFNVTLEKGLQEALELI